MEIGFTGRVAIVTGAGSGLGRSHALALAVRGARLVINDPARLADGSYAAETLAGRIVAEGGDAIANTDSVTDFAAVQAMTGAALERCGRIDFLVNNAGILGDKSFGKMDMADFKAVVDVHLIGSANCTRAVWDPMREQRYGRIAMTSSSSGLYGNYGQSNYGAAKMGLVGLMNVLCLEGAKYDIRVNCLAPIASTAMTTELLAEEQHSIMTVESVSAGLVCLVSDDAPNRVVLSCGGGCYAATLVYETEGVYLPRGEQTPESIAANFAEIVDPAKQRILTAGVEQTTRFSNKALLQGRENEIAPGLAD